MFDKAPLWIHGGIQHSTETARAADWLALSGEEGVATATCLKVTALPTPGSSVRYAPGVAAILSRFSGAALQTYVGRNPTTDTVAISPTSSAGGRSDLIVVAVDDFNYVGSTPPDPNSAQLIDVRVIQNVPAGTTSAIGRSTRYPTAVALARIDLPPSTATITNAMITDLRKIARPRSRALAPIIRNATAGLAISNEGNYFTFPGNDPMVDIPSWATRATVEGRIESVRHVHPATVGHLRLKLGSIVSQHLRTFDESRLTDGGFDRKELTVTGDFAVPPSMAGTAQRVSCEGVRTGGTGYFATDSYTRVVYNIRFDEAIQ